ncbi:uncharacterized protein F4822DRAFT_431110 [Hypoxylon trugodes]|uniref:uncharacterized protein n=1 Tax=Hypoxylon trugodes TaxID=326681 RepID=UPI002194A90C|nr:uncharacterized protein F4822DRAFT_431110 [Hypoxylon trugodes]KAI1386237.1 hypothetical protein F4822DRAFT_431110 [Hypoxylon trugodes]
MAVNETTETREGHEISTVSSSTSANRENAPALTTAQGQEGNAAKNVQTPSPIRQQPLPQPYPQYQAPYAPYPYQHPQPYPYAQVRVLPPYSKPWTVTKLVLTILTLVFAIVIMALSCALLPEGGDGEGYALFGLPISIASILWNGAELITYAVRARKNVKRGIHPGAHVGLHLCFWIACVFGVFFAVGISISTRSMIRECADYDSDSRYYYNYCDSYGYRDTEYMNNTYLPLTQSVIAFFCMITITHFVLFVLACIDTHKRNLLKPAGVVLPPVPPNGAMYYPPAQVPGAAPYYPYPMPVAPEQVRYAGAPSAPGAPGATEPKTLNPAAAGQNFQPLAGFYAPPPMSQAYQPPTHPAQQSASGSDHEKTVSTPAAAGQAV